MTYFFYFLQKKVDKAEKVAYPRFVLLAFEQRCIVTKLINFYSRNSFAEL